MSQDQSNKWKCKECGKLNDADMRRCSCGRFMEDASEKRVRELQRNQIADHNDAVGRSVQKNVGMGRAHGGLLTTLISSFFKTINKEFYDKGSIMGYIDMCEALFEDASQELNDQDPHVVLTTIYNYILVKSGGATKRDLQKQTEISWHVYTRTFKAACLPPPVCARALAYMMISDDDDLFMQFLTKPQYERYYKEYDEYVAPLIRADKDHLKKLYFQYNKNTEYSQAMFE